MKKIPLLLFCICILLVFGFSLQNKVNSKQKENKDVPVESLKKESKKPPFVIKSIDSKIAKMEDSASEKPLKGVIYRIILYSDKLYSPQQLTSIQFTLEDDSIINKAYPSPVAPVMLEKTLENGNLYTIQFETLYTEQYTLEELENLKSDRKFNLYASIKEKKVFYSTRW